MKKFVSILFVLAFAAASAAGFDAFAQKKVSARAGGSKRSSARGLPKEAPAPRASAENAPGSFPAPRAAVPPAPRASAENAPAAAKTAPAAKDSGATPAPPEGKPWKLDCQERFNMCMDDTCVNEQGIRYNCSSSLDSFETVTRDGNEVRLGSDLYTYAKGKCINIYGSCPLAERNRVENEYKIQIQSDFLTKNYLDVIAYAGEEVAQEALTELVSCMQPLCGPGWSDCFRITQIERRMGQCESVIKKTGRPLAVKRALYDELEKMLKTLCAGAEGNIDYETKKCSVKVYFGREELVWKDGKSYSTGRMSEEIGWRYFKVGEIVECTQEYLAVSAKRNDGFWHGVSKAVGGVAKMVAGAVFVVVGVIASIYGGGAGTPLIGSGIQMSAAGTADTMEGFVVMDGGVREGACFVGGKFIAPLGTFFKVGFMQ